MTKELSIKVDHQTKINALADAIVDSKLDPVSLEPKNYFAHGTYTRELFIPEGTVIAGKEHRYSCIAIIPYGHVTVTTDEGVYDVVGPKTLVTGTGSKGVYAHKDTLWITVHPWHGVEEVEEVEKYVIIPPERRITGGDK
jgi:hypothetical protein